MTSVYIGIGSNIEPAQNISQALDCLRKQFGVLRHSTTYANPAVGFDGPDFYNLVANFDSDLSVVDVVISLKEIEQKISKISQQPRFASRIIDLDLLLYANHVCFNPTTEIPNADILKYAFVLGPLAELAPELKHPVLKLSYRELWEKYPKDLIRLREVDIAD